MSFETKMKIILQIFVAIQLLWEKFALFPGFINY
jgi:hypothetical protein